MTRAQRLVLLFGLAGIVAMALFPPWDAFLRGTYKKWGALGYAPVFSPPENPPGEFKGRDVLSGDRVAQWRRVYEPRIAWGRLCLHWAAIAGVCAILLIILGERKVDA